MIGPPAHRTVATHLVAATTHDHIIPLRSTAMYTLNEALAREHLRDLQRQSLQVAQGKRAAAERRHLRAQRRAHRSTG